MALYRSLNPALVLCGRCLDSEESDARIEPLVDNIDESDDAAAVEALLVRAVCAAQGCPELQVRAHLCVDHVLEWELAFQNQIPDRSCHGCRQSVLALYAQHKEVWFILPPSATARSVRGVERRIWPRGGSSGSQDEAVLLQNFPQSAITPPDSRALRATRKSSSNRKRVRRSARQLRHVRNKERMRALDWSLGNVSTKQLYLWKDNERRLAAERNPTPPPPVAAPKTTAAASAAEPPPTASRPEPTSIFCEASGCSHYAKIGVSCFFHAPLQRPRHGSQGMARLQTVLRGDVRPQGAP